MGVGEGVGVGVGVAVGEGVYVAVDRGRTVGTLVFVGGSVGDEGGIGDGTFVRTKLMPGSIATAACSVGNLSRFTLS